MYACRVLSLILLVTIPLVACQPQADLTPEPATTGAEESPRSATISEIDNDVQTRQSASLDYAPASTGQILPVGGQARSGEASRGRIDLLPEATIVRLGPNSEFTLTDLDADLDAPFTRLELLFGQVWVILNGGELEVETDVGTASVRGSLLGVLFDPLQQIMTATCLEGTCKLENEAGRTDLGNMQAADIMAPGKAPSPARDLTPDEFMQWLDNNPEAAEAVGKEDSHGSTMLSLVVTNQCSTTYRWILTGPENHEIDTPPGGSFNLEVPKGEYQLVYYPLDGSRDSQITPITPETSAVDITICSSD